MAKFQKAINLRDKATSAAFYNGTLVLQCGQWLDIHGDGDLSRFVSINDIGYVDAVHSNGGNGKQQRKKFIFRARMARLNKQLNNGEISHADFRKEASKV